MIKIKIKLISYILAHTIFLSGCHTIYQQIINKDKTNLQSQDIATSQSTEYPKEKETTIEIIEAIEPTEPLIEETKKEEIVSAIEDTTIYSSNTTESLKISNFKINESALKILSYDNNWTLVKYNNQIGYVFNDYIQYSNSSIEKEYEYIEHKDIVLTTTNLNFRTYPTTESEIIETFKMNTELEVIAKVNNGWLLVKNNGTIGYVHEDYTVSILKKAQEQYPDLNLTELNIEKTVYSIGSSLNIRSGNSTDYEIIGVLEKYESIRVISEHDGWYFVMTNDYNFGYISINYTENLTGIFVVVDISKQRLYMYKGGKLCYIAPVTTGKDSTPSDIGLFKIWYKGQNEEISPGAHTNYWMPYNYNMEGLHDAEEWRDEYGITEEEDYNNCYRKNGSNGCVNMKLKDAKTVYENVSIGTKVLVHK